MKYLNLPERDLERERERDLERDTEREADLIKNIITYFIVVKNPKKYFF